MILTYSKPYFKDLILSGQKIHTIRRDRADRWRKGRIIHHWMHNPRNKHLNPHEFLVNHCVSTQRIIFTNPESGYEVWVQRGETLYERLSDNRIILLAYNDGLTVVNFITWFAPDRGINEAFHGKIIHWTEFTY